MEIILIRHGKPSAAINPKLSASGFANWVLDYDESDVSCESLPPDALAKLIKDHFIISSHLARSIDSVKKCLNAEPDLIHRKFREMEIPSYKLPFRLKAYTWLVVNRIAWFAGVNGNVESFKAAKLRAKNAAAGLMELASEHNKVAVFGHGLVNKSMANVLKKEGWHCTFEGKGYWSTINLRK